jgi:hypothetical protein
MRVNAIRGRADGQTLVEFALVFPMFVLLLSAVIGFGLFMFYSTQTANVAREAARYAAVHSTSAQCPTVSRLDPIASNQQDSYFRCDPPETGWPRMTARARSFVWGMDPASLSMAACWSGYVSPSNQADALPADPATFADCTIAGVDPRTDPSSLGCPAPATVAGSTSSTADGDDKASSLAFANGVHYPTTVTVYACVDWTPPFAGFLFIPETMTIRSVAIEAMQRQQ